MTRPQASVSLSTDINEVHLRGRLSATATRRELPSGDVLWSFRLVVDRPPGERIGHDAIDCVTSSARLARSLQSCDRGSVIEVNGRLRRRFWRGDSGLQSRYELLAEQGRVRSRRRIGA